MKDSRGVSDYLENLHPHDAVAAAPVSYAWVLAEPWNLGAKRAGTEGEKSRAY